MTLGFFIGLRYVEIKNENSKNKTQKIENKDLIFLWKTEMLTETFDWSLNASFPCTTLTHFVDTSCGKWACKALIKRLVEFDGWMMG